MGVGRPGAQAEFILEERGRLYLRRSSATSAEQGRAYARGRLKRRLLTKRRFSKLAQAEIAGYPDGVDNGGAPDMRRLIAASLAVTTALSGTFAPVPPALAAVQSEAPSTRDPEVDARVIWNLMEGDVESAGWEYVEEATGRAWGEPLERDSAENVMKLVEAAAAGDWAAFGAEATSQAVDALPRGLGLYVEAAQFVHGEMREAIDSWTDELYDHPSYARLEAMVEAAYRDTYRRFESDIGLEDQPFLPSYRLGYVTSRNPQALEQEQARMRAVEADLFQRWVSGTQAQAEEQDQLAYGGSLRPLGEGDIGRLFGEAYPARLRQALGYVPTDRQIFNHFYYRITRDRMPEYAENYRRVRERQARMRAIMARNDAVDEWLRLRHEREMAEAEAEEAPARRCPPSSLIAGHIGAGGDQSANIASLQQVTDMARASLIEEGIDPGSVPLFDLNRPVGGFLVDEVAVTPAELPAFEGGRFDGEIVLVLPPETVRAHFRGRPDSFAGGARTAEVPVGRAIGTIAPAYFNARFRNAWLSRSAEQVNDEPLSIELIGPEYSYRYGFGGIRGRLISELSLGVSVCLRGERVIDRMYDSGPVSETMSLLPLSEAAHAGPHGITLNNAIVSILEQALLDMAQTPGFERAVRGTPRQMEAARTAGAAVSEGRSGRLTPQEAFAQLEQLNAWRDQGRLTEAQYNDLRDQILSQTRD